MSKRTYAEFADGSDTNLTVLTADGGRIPAHAEVLRLVCSCMKNAPTSDTWDLRQLLIDGKHPTAETVSAVLEVIYQGLQALDFEMDKRPGRFSLLQLREMLLFADAVGCSKGCIDNMAALLGGCVMEELQINLAAERSSNSAVTGANRAGRGQGRGAAAGARSTSPPNGSPAAAVQQVYLQLGGTYTLQDADLNVWKGGRCHYAQHVTAEQEEHLCSETARQLEHLLYAAFKLNLQQLQEPLLRFLRNNTTVDTSLLTSTAAKVLTPRVVSEAGSSTNDLVTKAFLQQPLGRGLGLETYFRLDAANNLDTVSVNATMKRDLFELKSGTAVELEFNLVSGKMLVTALPVDGGDDEVEHVDSLEYTFGAVAGSERMFNN